MIAFNWSGLRPIFTSTSTPRSRKISAARGLRSSEMRTLGMGYLSCSVPPALADGTMEKGTGPEGPVRESGRLCLLGLRVGPVEPRQQGRDIGGLNRGTAPD